MKKIKKILSDSCILFTVFVFILLATFALLFDEQEGVVSGLPFSTALLIFICSVLLRVFHNILNVKKIHLAWRVIIHYILVVGTSFAAVLLINKLANNTTKALSSFIILTVLTLVYSGIIVISILIKNKRAEKKKEKKEYKSIVEE